MTKDINTGDTQDTNSGETATYRDTVDNAGTYDNAGTVDLQDAQEFATSASVNTTGWSIEITHPVSGRTIRPDAINPDQVQFIPGPNTMPRIRVPVRRAPSWLGEGFDNNPAMDVHLDGEQLPIDELVDVEQEEGQTVLVGEGGSELRTTVSAEYEAEERPTAATDLVSNNTSYTVVDDTGTPPSESDTVQSPSGESDLMALLTIADDVPLVFTGGGVKPAVTVPQGDGYEDRASSTGNLATATDYSGDSQTDGQGTAITLSPGETVTYEFDVEHTIPAGDVGVHLRQENTGGGTPDADWFLNGDLLTSINGSSDTEILGLSWDNVVTADFDGSGETYDGPDLTPSNNPHTIEVDCTGGGAGELAVDRVALADTRYSYNFDNTVTTVNGNNYLDGPELHPPSVDAISDTYESAFSIVGGSVSVTINDTTNNQALALSNDFGATYPISGSNTASVSGTFQDTGAALNLKATLSRYSPNGTRDASPREGYDAQRLDAYTLEADIEFESLLIDQTFSNSLVSVLNQILGNQYGWTITNESGTTTFTVDEPGSTVADRDPEISESTIEKKVQTYNKVTIKGSSLPVSGEEFQASSSFVDLTQDDILTGSEAVYDSSGTQYTRGVDYSIDYQAGEITALSGGDLTIGDNYQIDYRHQISASHTVSGATGDTLTRTIPGVVSDRQAEQIAYVLAEVYPGVATPRYEGRIVVPRLDVTFDPLEGLQLEDMDLPSVATPLSIRGEPQLSPLGLTLRLGSAPRLEESLSNIRDQVSAVSDRA